MRDYDGLIMKCADDIVEGLLREHWDDPEEYWWRDPHTYLLCTVPLISDGCTCGANGSLAEDHLLSCRLFAASIESVADEWLPHFELCERVSEQVDLTLAGIEGHYPSSDGDLTDAERHAGYRFCAGVLVRPEQAEEVADGTVNEVGGDR